MLRPLDFFGDLQKKYLQIPDGSQVASAMELVATNVSRPQWRWIFSWQATDATAGSCSMLNQTKHQFLWFLLLQNTCYCLMAVEIWLFVFLLQDWIDIRGLGATWRLCFSARTCSKESVLVSNAQDTGEHLNVQRQTDVFGNSWELQVFESAIWCSKMFLNHNSWLKQFLKLSPFEKSTMCPNVKWNHFETKRCLVCQTVASGWAWTLLFWDWHFGTKWSFRLHSWAIGASADQKKLIWAQKSWMAQPFRVQVHILSIFLLFTNKYSHLFAFSPPDFPPK